MIIDVHHHWIPREHVEHMEKYLLPGQSLEKKARGRVVKEGPWELFHPKKLFYQMDEQVRHLDQAGIDMAALSMGCYQDWTSARVAPEINDAMAEVQSTHPRRVIGLAHVDPLGPEAPAELERSIRELKLRGVSFNTHTRGKYPDSREFGPFYRKVAELGIPIVVHAASMAKNDYMRQVTWQGIGTPLLARAIDHMLATARIATGGVLKEFPTVKFIFGHLGGSGFFTLLERFGERAGVIDRGAMKSQLFFDTAPVGWGKLALETAVSAYGEDNVLMGSDYPAVTYDGPTLKTAVDAVKDLDIPTRARDKILGSTAAELFKI
ncbi:MAG: amidohydrolase [Chloroflexi bacterium]|nr:amidohydrolase [Chloroflexota bacterium]